MLASLSEFTDLTWGSVPAVRCVSCVSCAGLHMAACVFASQSWVSFKAGSKSCPFKIVFSNYGMCGQSSFFSYVNFT